MTTAQIITATPRITMKEPLELTVTEEDDGWYVGIAEEGIEINMRGETREEALVAFWDYIYGLIPDLENDEGSLSEPLKMERDFLRKHFEYWKV